MTSSVKDLRLGVAAKAPKVRGGVVKQEQVVDLGRGGGEEVVAGFMVEKIGLRGLKELTEIIEKEVYGEGEGGGGREKKGSVKKKEGGRRRVNPARMVGEVVGYVRRGGGRVLGVVKALVARVWRGADGGGEEEEDDDEYSGGHDDEYSDVYD